MLENSNIKNSSNASLNTNETLNYSNIGMNLNMNQKNLGKKRFNEKIETTISDLNREIEGAKQELNENANQEEAYVDFEDDEINDEKESKYSTPKSDKEKNIVMDPEKKGKIRKFKKSLNALSAPNLNFKKFKGLNDSAKKSNEQVEHVPEEDLNKIIDIKEEEDSKEIIKINKLSGKIILNSELNKKIIKEINELKKEIEAIKKKDDVINELREQLKAYEDEAKERNALSLSMEDNKIIKKLIEEKKNGNEKSKEECENEKDLKEIKNNIEELKAYIPQLINENLAKSFKENLKKQVQDLLKQNNDEMQQNLIGDLSSIKYDLDSKMADVDSNATIAELIKEIKEKSISEITEIKSLLDSKADKNDVSKEEIERIKQINVELNKKISQLENQNENLKKEIKQNNYLENVQENGAINDMNANLNLNLKKIIALINSRVSININNYNLEYNIKKKEVIKNIYIELANNEYFINWIKEKWKEWNVDNISIMTSHYNKINELSNEIKGYAKDIMDMRNILLIKNQINDINDNAKNLMNAMVLKNNEFASKENNSDDLLKSIREINKDLFNNIKENIDKDIKRIKEDINNKENNIKLSYEKMIDEKIRELNDKIDLKIKNKDKERDERYKNDYENINNKMDKVKEDIILKVGSLSPKKPDFFEELRPMIGIDYKNDIQNLKNELNQKINNIEIKINNDTSIININNRIDNLTSQFNLINNLKKNEVIIEKNSNNVPNMSNIGNPSINIYPPTNTILKDNNDRSENMNTMKSIEKIEKEMDKKIASINKEIDIIKNEPVVKKEECIKNKNNIKVELMQLINSLKEEIKIIENKYDEIKMVVDDIKILKEDNKLNRKKDERDKVNIDEIMEEIKKEFYTKEEINQRDDIEVIDEERAQEIAREILKEGINDIYNKKEIDKMIDQLKTFKKKNLIPQNTNINFKIIQMAKKKENKKNEEQKDEKESDNKEKKIDKNNNKENKNDEENSKNKENNKKPIEPIGEHTKKEDKGKILCTKENCKYCKAIENLALNNKKAIIAINEEMSEINKILKEIENKISNEEIRINKIEDDGKKNSQEKEKLINGKNKMEEIINPENIKEDLKEIIAKIAEQEVKGKIEEKIKESLINKEANNKGRVSLKELVKKERDERKNWMIEYFAIKEGKIKECIKKELEKLNDKICVRRIKLEVENKKINNKFYFSVQNDNKGKKDNNADAKKELRLHITVDDINSNSYNKDVSMDYDDQNMIININKEIKICAVCLKENHDGKECINWIQDSVIANWMYNKKDVLKESKIKEAIEKIIKCKYCMETNHNDEECMNSIDLLKIIAKYVIAIKKEKDKYIIEKVDWEKASFIIDKILELKKKCSEKDMFKNIWKNIRMKGSRSIIEWFKKNRIIFKESDLNSNEKKKILMDEIIKQLRKVQKNKMIYAKKCFTKMINTIARKVAMIQVLTNEVNGKINKNIQILNIGRNNITEERNKIIREIEVGMHVNRNNNLAEMIKTNKREIKTANTLLKSPKLGKRNEVLIRSFIKNRKYNLGKNKRKLNATVDAKSKVNKYLKEVEIKENNKQDKKMIILREINDYNKTEDDKEEKEIGRNDYEEEEKIMDAYEPPRDDGEGNDSESDVFDNMMSGDEE